ncbi:MAG: FMN-binding protein [Bacillota bacterium]
MWVKILIGFVVFLGVGGGVAYSYGVRGMKETLNAHISHVDLQEVADGVYQGKYEAGRFRASVEVTVKDHKIVSIAPLGLNENKVIDKAILNVFVPDIGRIVEAQTPNVDIVSGSTATTKSLLKAVEDALVRAGGKKINE